MTPRPQPDRRRAFTLLEVLMAIAILVILVGILVGGAFASYRWAKQRRTIAVLSTLDAVVNEYRETTGKYLPDTVNSTGSFLNETFGSAGDGSGGTGRCAELLQSLDAALIRPSPGATPTDVVDAWGTSIVIYNCNRAGWSNSISYYVNDSVTLNGKRYRCVTAASGAGQAPPTPPTTGNTWWVEDATAGRTYFWSCGVNGVNDSVSTLGRPVQGDDLASNGTNQ